MKRIGALFVALLAGLLVLAVVLQPETPSWNLPDGSTLRLAKITWGTNHVFRYGHRPIDLLYPFIPASSRSNFNFQVANISAPPPGALVVWFKRSGISTKPVPQPTPSAPGRPPVPTTLPRGSEPFMVSVTDDYGVESRTSSDVRVVAMDDSTEIVGVVLSSYPRRAKTFSGRIHWSAPVRPASSGGSTTLLEEFRVANPGSKFSQPGWAPEPLPATHQTNGLELTLLSLESGMTVADALQRRGAQSRSNSTMSDFSRRTYSRATFEVKENGISATNWGICRWTLNNAVGEGQSLGISPTALLKPAEVIFPQSLWLDEPAWKLEVELERTTGFPTEEIWTIKKLSLPVPGQPKPSWNELATNFNGASIKILDVSWTGFTPNVTSQVVRPGQIPPIPPLPDAGTAPSRMVPRQLAFNVQAPDSVRLNLIEVRDEQGQRVALENFVQRPASSRGIASPGTLLWILQFNFPADARTADLTIVVSPRRNFEFYAKPTLATNGSAAK